VEHFANHKNAQTFLTVDFIITCMGSANYYERCLACYPADKEKEEKRQQSFETFIRGIRTGNAQCPFGEKRSNRTGSHP